MLDYLRLSLFHLQSDEFNPLKTNHLHNDAILQLKVLIISAQELPKPANSVLGERGEVSSKKNMKNILLKYRLYRLLILLLKSKLKEF